MWESIERVVEVQDFSKSIFLLVLKYLYVSDGVYVGVENAVEFYRMADMYQLLEGLMSACRQSLSNEFVLDDVSLVKALQVLERNGSTCGALTTMISMFDSATLE
jgi:hypothetical protein